MLWPDNDEQGKKAMRELASTLAPFVADLKIVDPSDLPIKGDAADLGAGHDMVAWIRRRAAPYGTEFETSFNGF